MIGLIIYYIILGIAATLIVAFSLLLLAMIIAFILYLRDEEEME